MMPITFEHVGMTVKNIDSSLAFYAELLGLALVARRRGRNGDEVAFLEVPGGVMLELVCPATGALPSEDVAVGRAGMRHITFRVDSVAETYGMLEEAGVDMVEPPRNAHNPDIASYVGFCRDPDGILIELIER